MGSSGILDTSVLIDMDLIAEQSLPTTSFLTTITLAELSAGPLVAATQKEREVRQRHLQEAEAGFTALPFDAVAARAFGTVSASLRRAGRKPNARTYDALIAAIAVANDLPVYTCNPDDFAGIEGLSVIPVRRLSS